MNEVPEQNEAISPTIAQKAAFAVGATLCFAGTACAIWAEHDSRLFFWAICITAPGVAITLAAVYLDKRYWQRRKP